MPQSKTIPMTRAAAIVPGPGTTAVVLTSTVTFSTPAIQINAGDVVVAFAQVNTTTTTLDISSPSNPSTSWTEWNFNFTPFFMTVWVLENPVPANEPITFTRGVTGFGMAVVQVYSGVGAVGDPAGMLALSTSNPSLTPAVYALPNTTVVGGFFFNRGSSQSFAPSGHRLVVLGASYSAALADQPIATAGSAQIAMPSTSTTPTGFQYFAVALVLVPTGTTQPPPSGIPAIVQSIIQWRLQAQADKIYLMPPAQRTARLAEFQSLAQQLKQAQIAQMQ